MAWERGSLHGESTVVVRCGGARLAVAERGATVLSWAVPGADGDLVDLADGYRSAEELVAQELAAFAVMAPFSNRIRGARYTFDGVEHDLQPGVPEDEREIMHGLVRGVTWEVVDAPTDGAGHREVPDGAAGDTTPRGGPAPGDAEAHVSLTTSIRPEDHPGYPFAVDLRVTYTLGPRSLAIEIEAVNAGEVTAPVALGWHPYFQLPGHDDVDGLELKVPALARVVADDAGIPLEGSAAFERVEGPVTWTPIGDAELDDAFVVPVSAGEVRTVLRSPRTGASIEVFQRPGEAGIMHVYTGDTLPARQREAVAMEPVALMTDAFNRVECESLVPLKPGGRRRLRARVVFHPGT
ncbi:aldose 1-epimerase [Georgenia sp. MJ206]|uniref:aldose 1-epimerase n=1 Tax=Georgenia wangjunii TaxID=3117730 RepID=UPI002F260286